MSRINVIRAVCMLVTPRGVRGVGTGRQVCLHKLTPGTSFRCLSSGSNSEKRDDNDTSISAVEGIKSFWKEFRHYRSLRCEKGTESPGENGSRFNSLWTRRELDLAKRINSDMLAVGVIAVVFCIPGGSLVIAAALLKFPRYLTSHFWSTEIRDQNLLNNYLAKEEAQKNIEQVLTGMNTSVADLSKDWKNVATKTTSNSEQYWTLLRWLGVYHDVVNSYLSFLFVGRAASLLVSELVDDRIDEILEDDFLLLRENDANRLDRWELQRACTDRMLCLPTLSNSEMQAHLHAWILLDSQVRLRKLRIPSRSALALE